MIGTYDIIALKLYGRHWKKVEQHVGTRSGTQIRSHAQKHFLKVGSKKNPMISQQQIDPQKLGILPENSMQLLQTPQKTMFPAYQGISKEEQKIDSSRLATTPSPLQYRSLLQSYPQANLFPPNQDNEHELNLMRKYTDSIMNRISRLSEIGLAADRLKLLNSLEIECNHINSTLYQIMPRITLGMILEK